MTTAGGFDHTDPGLPLASLVDQLRTERDGLRRAMRARSVIEQAKGILMAAEGIGADEAFVRLRERSQHSNVRVADVAAALVAATSPPPEPGAPLGAEHQPGPGTRSQPSGRSAAPGRNQSPPVVVRQPVESALHAQHLLLASRLGEAGGYDDLVAAVAATAAGWPAPNSVVLALAEPDGALRVVANHGLSAEIASQWNRVPPQVDVPLTAALRTAAPVWLADADQVRRDFPIMAAMDPSVLGSAVMPLAVGDRLLGVLGLTWTRPVTLDDQRRSYLSAGAAAVTAALNRLTSPDDAESAPWTRALFDAALTPTALVTAVRVGREVVDFRVGHVNDLADRAAEAAGLRLSGSTVLTAMPALGARVLVPLCRAVLDDGLARRLDAVTEPGTGARYSVSAARLGQRVIVSWRRYSPAELLHDDLVAAGRVARVAVFRCPLPTGVLLATPVLRELLDWSAGPAPTARTALAAVDRGHRSRLRAAAFTTLRHGPVTDLTVPVGRGRRWLRVVADRDLLDGRPVALRGWVQDVTDLRANRSREYRLAEARAARRGTVSQ